MRKKILAIVLARKGSVRLKNKNVLMLKGKPLIEWTFKKLYKKNIRKLFVDVLVSTDSIKIQNIAKKYKFLCPWLRPKKLSGRFSTSEAAALHAVKWYENNVQKINGLFLFQPTSPFRSQKKIIAAVKLFKKKKKQVVSVCSRKTYKFNINDINGSLYLTPVALLKKFKTFKKKGFIKIKINKASENLDIDTLADMRIAKKSKV
jgi:CMP-N,N'-diacetyllegionaminic acid synthase